jgi:hypothetical protein
MDPVQTVKPFLQTWPLQALQGTEQSLHWNGGLASSLLIPADCSINLRLKKIALHEEPARMGKVNVFGSLTDKHIGVVDRKALLGCHACCYEHSLALPRLQHIQAKPDMRLKETLPIKSGLA